MSNFIEIDNEYININSISAVGKIDRTNDGRICFYIFMTGGSENYFRISREADQLDELEVIHKKLIEKLMPPEPKTTDDGWIKVEDALPSDYLKVVVSCQCRLRDSFVEMVAAYHPNEKVWIEDNWPRGRVLDWDKEGIEVKFWRPFQNTQKD
jgi:hypothetical protein